MGWVQGVTAVLAVIERLMPLAERLVPQPGAGETKRTLVLGAAEGVAATMLPQVSLQDPTIQALLRAKVAADVALANALQDAQDRATAPDLSPPPTP